jgi:GTP-binding protein Era
MAFRSGYANIIGKPNVGKSTLINALLGEKIAITSPKVQTTRHRILGMMNGDDYQIVFSDTPGIIPKPKYKLHEAMMKFVSEAIEDADVIFYMVDPKEDPHYAGQVLEKILATDIPSYLIINKIDTLEEQEQVEKLFERWSELIPKERIIPVSALKAFNILSVFEAAYKNMPENPPYFPEEQFTDKTERFLAAEVIREKIFNNYREEIPYSAEVIITSFKEEEPIIRIAAEIYVEKQSQKGILIGKGGESLKRIGTQARVELEAQYGKKVFLEVFVKVRDNWRENPGLLRQFGFDA